MDNTPSHHTDATKEAYRGMCHTGDYNAAFIKVHFQLRLKPDYRELPNIVKVYYTQPEAIPEEILKIHPLFKKSYKNLKKIETAKENDIKKGILITDYALKEGPIDAMIAVSCISFYTLLMANEKKPCKQILRLSAQYPKVKNYVLQSDIGNKYFKNPQYFIAIKEMAKLDAKFALEVLQDESIKAQFLTHPSGSTLLEVVEALYIKVLNTDSEPDAIKDLLTLMDYITQILQVHFTGSEDHVKTIKQTLIALMSQTYTQSRQQTSETKSIQNRI